MDNNALGLKNGLIASPIASISITVSDTNFHYLTIVSPAQFNNPRVFTIQPPRHSGSAAYTLNENPGLSHASSQFLFRETSHLTADASVSGGAMPSPGPFPG